MGFLNTILVFIQDFFESVFSSSSPEFTKKQQLKQLSANLKAFNPPIFRQDGFLLPSFPATVYQINQFLLPIKEILNATLENPDRRISERYRDYLIELVLTEEQRATRKKFTFTERSEALLAQKLPPERFIEEQGKQFSQFIKILDSSTMHQAGILLEKLDSLVDFCQFDFNAFFVYFDPAFKPHTGQSSTVESPYFHSVEVVELIPILMDLFYILSKVEFNSAIIDILSILEAKKNAVALDDEIKNRISKYCNSVSYLLQKRLNKDTILAIIRVTKQDPDFLPEQPTFKTDYIMQYKTRITEFFHSDSVKLLKDEKEGALQSLISATFGNRELEKIQGYTQETNALLQEFTPFSLEWIKPLEIIKTFSLYFFIPHFKQIFRSILVEGYFNNRSLQSSFSSSYYYCEAVSAKLAEFEKLFLDNEPCSLSILTGYLTELQKGMDFEKPLRKMVENMNSYAKALVQQTVNQYAEVYNFSTIILEDNKKTVPEYITNIRNLTISTKNTESFAWLEKENGVFRNFLEIMKKYAIVGTLSVPSNLREQTEN